MEDCAKSAVMELSTERLRIADQLQAVIQKINSSGITTQENLDEFVKAKIPVPRFFGEEVQKYVDKLFIAMLKHWEQCVMLPETAVGENRSQLVRNKGESWTEIVAFYREFPELTADYIQMHAKIPRERSILQRFGFN